MDEELLAYLDKWLQDQHCLLHSTTLERIVDGVEEFNGQKRTYKEWMSDLDD